MKVLAIKADDTPQGTVDVTLDRGDKIWLPLGTANLLSRIGESHRPTTPEELKDDLERDQAIELKEKGLLSKDQHGNYLLTEEAWNADYVIKSGCCGM